MIRRFHLTALSILALSSAAAAGQLTYSGTTSGVFTNPIGGVSHGAGTSSFEFGGWNGATLSFTPSSNFNATDGVPFKLGQVSLSNGSPVNAPSQVTFAVTLNFKTPTGLGTETFNFATGIITQGRDTVGAFSAAFDEGGKSTITTADGTKYTLELLGLTNSSTWGGSVFSSLSCCPADGCSANIWGELIQTPAPPQVPEPSSLLLGGAALGMVGFARFRRRDTAAAQAG